MKEINLAELVDAQLNFLNTFDYSLRVDIYISGKENNNWNWFCWEHNKIFPCFQDDIIGIEFSGDLDWFDPTPKTILRDPSSIEVFKKQSGGANDLYYHMTMALIKQKENQ